MSVSDLDARYAELEAAADDKRRARMRRQPLLLIGLLGALVLGIGAVASVDLHRLRTPQGVALRWAQAALFGDCGDYLRFSTGPVDRPQAELCRDLRSATAQARRDNVQIGLKVRSVTVRGSTAVVVLDVTRTGVVQHATVDEQRSGGRWRVVRDATSCAVLGCA